MMNEIVLPGSGSFTSLGDVDGYEYLQKNPGFFNSSYFGETLEQIEARLEETYPAYKKAKESGNEKLAETVRALLK